MSQRRLRRHNRAHSSHWLLLPVLLGWLRFVVCPGPRGEGGVSLCLPRAGARVVPLLRLQGGGRDPPRPRGGPPPFLPRSEWRPGDEDENAAAKEDADELGIELACAEKVNRACEGEGNSHATSAGAPQNLTLNPKPSTLGSNHRTSPGAPQ